METKYDHEAAAMLFEFFRYATFGTDVRNPKVEQLPGGWYRYTFEAESASEFTPITPDKVPGGSLIDPYPRKR